MVELKIPTYLKHVCLVGVHGLDQTKLLIDYDHGTPRKETCGVWLDEIFHRIDQTSSYSKGFFTSWTMKLSLAPLKYVIGH